MVIGRSHVTQDDPGHTFKGDFTFVAISLPCVHDDISDAGKSTLRTLVTFGSRLCYSKSDTVFPHCSGMFDSLTNLMIYS